MLCLTALALVAGNAQAAKDDLDLVSRATGATDPFGICCSDDPAISDDGRLVVYESWATTQHPDDTDNRLDVFVRDLQTNTTTLISRATGASGVKGNDDSGSPAISSDGRFVVFVSNATNLSPDDADTTRDVYVRDLQTRTTTLVSRASADGVKANNNCSNVAISADGRFVAFYSSASNLSPDDGDATDDVFVRDLQANTTILVSRATGASGVKGDRGSYEPAISGDGRFVAFESVAFNLHPDDPDRLRDVFVRDLQANTTTLVTRAAGASGAKGNAHSYEAAISGDGRFVAFESNAFNLHPDDGDDGDNTTDVFVRDLQSKTTTLVSRATGAGGAPSNFFSFSPALSRDGRLVSFESWATNLHPDDTDGLFDVFVRDLRANTTTLLSRAAGAGGANSNGPSRAPAVSGDGRFVTFESTATNLHPDAVAGRDVYRRQIGTEPSAGADAYTTGRDTPLTVAAPGVLGNDADPDGDPMGAKLVSGPAHGTVALNADGSFRYSPAGGYSGADAFAYRASDGAADSSAAMVAITVNAPPPPPPPPPPAPPVAPPPPAPAVKPLCQGLRATIVGTAGRDVLRGTPKADVIVALGGNDAVRAGGGNDRVCAGAGNDRVEGGAGADRLEGAAGRDLLLGGRGNDLLLGGPGKDVMRGGPGKDRMNGGPGRDRSLP